MTRMVSEAVEAYLASLNSASDAALDAIRAEGVADRLPIIDAEVGALLSVLARAVGARRILEIGTAIGYSGSWLARALEPGGLLLTIEFAEARAERARHNFERTGVADRANVMVGDAARLEGPLVPLVAGVAALDLGRGGRDADPHPAEGVGVRRGGLGQAHPVTSAGSAARP